MKMGSTNSRLTSSISGKPARVIGNAFVPSSGTITAQIAGDILQTTVTSGWEKKKLFIRIQNVDSVEITEAPIYALLGLGCQVSRAWASK